MPLDVYLNVAVGGVLTGLVYGLLALGLSVIFGVVRVVNFAHGEFAVAAMYAAWGLFTAVMFLGTFRLNRALQLVFGSLAVLFFLLAIENATGAGTGFKHFAGYEGIICGLSAMYAGLAQVLNEVSGKTVLPLGSVST